MENQKIELDIQERDKDVLIKEITNLRSSYDMNIYQIDKSIEIKRGIHALLTAIKQQSYIFTLNIEDYIRNNVRDVSFLKQMIKEKVHSNLGD